MRFRRELVRIGWIFYVSSFFLTAVGPSDSRPIRGYDCAYVTLFFSWEQARIWLRGIPSISNPSDYISTLVSGWINPVFLIAVALTSFKRSEPFARVAAIIVILMIPSCWIVFYNHNLYPREGHVVWIAGMVLVLWSRGEFSAK
jgi:hypothetical protein